MKTLRKIVCLLLAVMMVFSLTACGSKKKDDTSSAAELAGDQSFDMGTDSDSNTGDNTSSGSLDVSVNDTTSSGNTVTQSPTVKDADKLAWKDLVAQMPSSLRGTTVTVYSWNDAKDVTGAEKVISNFTRQTGIKVNWMKGSYENYASEIAAKINSGTAPDIIRYINPLISTMSLTQDVKSATGFDFKGDIWDKALTDAYTIKGKIYGVNLKNTFNQQPTVVTYSKSTIDRYKLDDPYELWKNGEWNVDTFTELCKLFKEETSRPAWMTSFHLDTLWFNGVNMITFDGKSYKNNLKDKNVLNALKQATYFKEDGLMSDAARDFDKLENGTYLFFTTNILAARRTDYHFPNLKANDDLYCVPIPTGFTTKFYQPYQEYEAYGIPKGAKNPQAVYYFLRYYLDANNYDRNFFFCNEQTLEVYEWCRKQTPYYTVDGSLTKLAGNEYAGLSGFIRLKGITAQLQSEIDKNANPIVDRAVKMGNEYLAKFK